MMIASELTSELTAEQALIGSLLLDPSHLPLIADEVSAADFVHDPDLGILFEAMGTLADAGVPLGDVTVSLPQFRSMGVPAGVCSAAYLARITLGSQGCHALYYAKAVRRASRIRQLARIAAELQAYTERPDADPEQICRWLDVVARSTGFDAITFRHVRDVSADVVARLADPMQRKHPVMTGLYSFDNAIGGFCGGELIILAARPGVGKTALAMQIAMNAARRGTVLYCSLEMERSELIERVLASTADVNARKLRAQQLDDAEIGRIADAAAREVSACDLYVDDSPHATVQHMRGTAKRLAAKGDLRLIVVDYIGLINHPDQRAKDWERIADITRGLKQLAKELNVPVLALSQLNRAADAGEPQLIHLARSSSIEADADMVVIIHAEPGHETERVLIVAKNRHGETGSFRVTWIPNRTRFEDQSRVYSEFAGYAPRN